MQKILSLDGGGIRGIITAIWLDALQKKMNKPIKDSFDLVAGTSTGSLLAAAISIGKSPAEIISIHESRGEEIFPDTASRLWSRFSRTFQQGFSAPKFSQEGLSNVLKDVFGKTKLGDLPIKTLIISYDTINRDSIIFKSWKTEHQKLYLWEVCASSCSAPTYFPSHSMVVESKERSMIDGGVVANNPAACALAEMLRLNKLGDNPQDKTLQNLLIASFGTGQLNRTISLKEAQEWGALEWAIPIIDVLFDGSTDSVDYIVRNIVDSDKYYRFQVELTKALDDMDDASKTNIEALKRLALSYIGSGDGLKQLSQLSLLL